MAAAQSDKSVSAAGVFAEKDKVVVKSSEAAAAPRQTLSPLLPGIALGGLVMALVEGLM